MGNRFFQGVNSADASQRGNFFPYEDAHYKVEIDRCLVKSERSKVMIAECIVLESSTPTVKVGDRRTWLQTLDKEPEVAKNALKAFALAMIGVNAKNAHEVAAFESMCEDALEMACGAGNAFSGQPVMLDTIQWKTKKKGTDFTIHNWSPAPDNLGCEEWRHRIEVFRRDGHTHAAERRDYRPDPSPHRAPPPPPPPPPGVAVKPWEGKPVSPDGKYYYDGITWVLFPPGAVR